MTKARQQQVESLTATMVEHLDAAVSAPDAQTGINALRRATDVCRQVIAAGVGPVQAEYLLNEVSEVKLVFECRGWA